jgi:putative Ca2+/H+ antiporter (TMEM165/GDT1 family)
MVSTDSPAGTDKASHETKTQIGENISPLHGRLMIFHSLPIFKKRRHNVYTSVHHACSVWIPKNLFSFSHKIAFLLFAISRFMPKEATHQRWKTHDKRLN